MEATYFYLTLVTGLIISLLIEEFIGITAGGMIVPGYLALVCDDLSQVFLIFAISLLIYVIVNYVISRHMILFGKRKFVATLIVGVLIKLLLEVVFPYLPFAAVAFGGIGVITPALIANTCSRQGFKYTIPTCLAASYATFLIVSAVCWFL